MIDLNSLISKLKSGELPAYSELDLMNEKRQSLPQGVGIPKFAYGYQKRSRVLFRLQIAIPFNPETGMPDENFNPNKKWRPPVSPRTAAMIVKNYADKNEKAKEVLIGRAGVSDWDTSQPEILNKDDFKVLRSYRMPLVITTEATTINDAAITGQDFGISYSVPVKRDIDTGQIIGSIPEIAKMGNFMSAITFKEISELNDAVKLKDPSKYKNHRPFINPSAISSVDEKTKKEWTGKILGSALISAVRPKNFLIAYEFQLSQSQSMLTTDKKPLPCFTKVNAEDIKEHSVYFDYAKKYKNYIDAQLLSEDADKFWDFVEADICDNASEEPKDRTAKAEASRNMSLAASSHSFYNIDTDDWRANWVQPFFDAVSEFGDSDPNFERKMMQFIARQVRAIDDKIIGAVADRIAEKVPLSYQYITDDILLTHRDALLLIYGEDYTSLLIDRGLLSSQAVSVSGGEQIEKKKEEQSVTDLIDSAYEESEEDDDIIKTLNAGLSESIDKVLV